MRLDTWHEQLQKDTDEEAVSKTVKEKWEVICDGLKDWARPHYLDVWQSYGHTLLCHRQMGLGP